MTEQCENRARKQADALIRKMMADAKDFALWGAGATGAGALEFLRQESAGMLVPRCIVDNNRALWGRDRVVSPDEFMAMSPLPERMIVSVYVADQVIAQLEEMGYEGEVIELNLNLTENRRDFYDSHMDELEELYSILEDAPSRNTLIGFLNGIRGNDVTCFQRINGNSGDKLLDAEILKYTEKEMFVDVGAFTGDTIEKFLELTGGKYREIIGIEADRRNYEVLCSNIVRWGLDNIGAENIAIGEADGVTFFSADKSESCSRAGKGDLEVQMKCLDKMEKVRNATFLKISANGYELQALRGAENLILRNRPKISVYASGALLWEIPRYLRSMVPEYKIFCRHYGTGVQAMICYAVL